MIKVPKRPDIATGFSTFSGKVTIITFFISLIGITGIAILAYVDSSFHLERKTKQALKLELSRMSSQLETKLEAIRQDVLFVTSLIRENVVFSLSTGQILTKSKNTHLDLLKKILVNLIRVHPHCTQIRFLNNQGWEVIRIERVNNKIVVVPFNKLQNKSSREYFIASKSLRPGEVSISEITLNREYGKISQPYMGMMRVFSSLRNINGFFLGTVIINNEVANITRFFEKPSSDSVYFLANNRGDFIKHPNPDFEFGFELGHRHTVQDKYPGTQSFFRSGIIIKNSATFDLPELKSGLALKRLSLNPSNPSHYLVFGIARSYEFFKVDNLALRNDLILLGVIIVLLVTLGIHQLLGPILKPIKHLTCLAKKITSGEEKVQFEADYENNEIGNLYQAFKTMVQRLEDSRERAVKEKNDMTVLCDAIRAANGAENIQTAIQRTLHYICTQTEWDIGHVYLVVKSGHESLLKPTNTWYNKNPEKFGEFIQLTEKTPFLPGHGLPGRVLLTGEPEFIPDINNNEMFPRGLKITNLELSSAFAFPILAKNQIVAILEFFSEKPLGISSRKFELLKSIGAQLGPVIEREMINEIKTQFITVAAHELRTPLASIRGYSELLKNRDLGTEKIQKYAEIINHESEGLVSILNDLTDLDKMDRGEMFSLDIKTVNAIELVQKELELFKESPLPGIHFTFKYPNETLFWDVDASKISQVLKNLISNAVKYSPKGGNICIFIEKFNNSILVSIQDSGIGIPPQDVGKVFDKFFRSKDVIKDIGGLGLGLAISKRLIELHGGSVEVKSEFNKGTRVSFSIPSSKAAPGNCKGEEDSSEKELLEPNINS